MDDSSYLDDSQSYRDFSEYLDPVDCEFQFHTINNENVYRQIMKLNLIKEQNSPKTNKGFCSCYHTLSEPHF